MGKQAGVPFFLIAMLLLIIGITIITVIFAPKIIGVSRSFFSSLDEQCAETGKLMDEYVIEIRAAMVQNEEKKLRELYAELKSCFPGIENKLENFFTKTEADELLESKKVK